MECAKMQKENHAGDSGPARQLADCGELRSAEHQDRARRWLEPRHCPLESGRHLVVSLTSKKSFCIHSWPCQKISQMPRDRRIGSAGVTPRQPFTTGKNGKGH